MDNFGIKITHDNVFTSEFYRLTELIMSPSDSKISLKSNHKICRVRPNIKISWLEKYMGICKSREIKPQIAFYNHVVVNYANIKSFKLI